MRIDGFHVQIKYTPEVDTASPIWSTNTTEPISPSTYIPNNRNRFNITWTDNFAVSEVILEFNNTNYSFLAGQVSKEGSRYYINITDLWAKPSGYLYRWYSNDTSNNWNQTGQMNFSITKNTTTLALSITPSNTVNYPTTTTATGSNCPAQLTCTLYRTYQSVSNPESMTL